MTQYMNIFAPGFNETMESRDGKTRVRIAYDPEPMYDPLEWDHGCSVYPVALPRNVRESYYTAENNGPLDQLWERVWKRMEDCDPIRNDFTVEGRADEDVSYGLFTTGGLLRTRKDAVEVFTRLARLQGVTVQYRALYGNSQGDWADVIAWSTESNDHPKGVLDELQCYMQGEIYGLITEELTRWTSENGDVIDSWDEVESVWGIVGDDHAKAEAESIIEYVNDQAQ